jgi:hypothetical protein
LSSLTPPENDAKFWTELWVRYGRAAKGLKAPAAQALATDLAESARKTAVAVQSAPAPAAPATSTAPPGATKNTP